MSDSTIAVLDSHSAIPLWFEHRERAVAQRRLIALSVTEEDIVSFEVQDGGKVMAAHQGFWSSSLGMDTRVGQRFLDADHWTSFTTGDGEFEIPGLWPCSTRGSIQAPELIANMMVVDLPPGDVTSIEAPLDRANELVGRVVAVDGSPIESPFVHIAAHDSRGAALLTAACKRVRTDVRGPLVASSRPARSPNCPGMESGHRRRRVAGVACHACCFAGRSRRVRPGLRPGEGGTNLGVRFLRGGADEPCSSYHS